MTLHSVCRALQANTSGSAMTEFALGAPFLLMAGLWGVELANYSLVNMKVNQLAMQIADNASRIGETTTLRNRKIYEEDVNDLLLGASIQGGKGLNLYEHGRVIVSSLEIWDSKNHKPNGVVTTDGTPYIAWQRCKGVKHANSGYGVQNAALPKGVGPVGEEILPDANSPVIFTEVTYDYQPLFSSSFITNTEIKAFSILMVRDDRDQWDIYKRNSDTPIADCKTYDAFL